MNRHVNTERRASDPSTQSTSEAVHDDASSQEARTEPHTPPAHVQAAAARWKRITELNARLTEALDSERRALWLALEEALHVHWLDVAVDHYHRGYAAGRAQAWLDSTVGDETCPLERLRALSAALHELVDVLQRPPPRSDA